MTYREKLLTEIQKLFIEDMKQNDYCIGENRVKWLLELEGPEDEYSRYPSRTIVNILDEVFG